MRKLRPILAALLLCVALPMSAQFMNVPSPVSDDSPKSYNRITVAYIKTLTDGDGGKDYYEKKRISLDGVCVQFNREQLLSKTTPFCLDFGARLSFTFVEGDLGSGSKYLPSHNGECGYGIQSAWYKTSLIVPINAGYMINLGKNATLMPYAGLHFTANILGIAKQGSRFVSLFDKDKYTNNGGWNHCQYGSQIGVTGVYRKLSFGLEYSYDFKELAEDLKTSDLLLSLGVAF